MEELTQKLNGLVNNIKNYWVNKGNISKSKEIVNFLKSKDFNIERKLYSNGLVYNFSKNDLKIGTLNLGIMDMYSKSKEIVEIQGYTLRFENTLSMEQGYLRNFNSQRLIHFLKKEI